TDVVPCKSSDSRAHQPSFPPRRSTDLSPLVNARPSADFDAAAPGRHATPLRSALVAPLIFNDRLIGTLAAYHLDADFYSDDHRRDRKSTRLNSSHVKISYAVFCLKKKR